MYCKNYHDTDFYSFPMKELNKLKTTWISKIFQFDNTNAENLNKLESYIISLVVLNVTFSDHLTTVWDDL